MATHYEVDFIRLTVTGESAISVKLAEYYAHGWRVVSHAESEGEYSFVLERPVFRM